MKKTSRAWISARFCDYPQALHLRLIRPAHVTAVQILSHQNKIATQIELHVSVDSGHSFVKLGYMSMDSNARSQYRARELKTVHVSTRATDLKLMLKQPYTNAINVFNQVGVVAINIAGRYIDDGNTLDAGLLIGAPEPRVDNQSTTVIQARYPGIDAKTAEKLAMLEQEKADAVKREDYDEAKRIKAMVDALKGIAGRLVELQRQKQAAVESEDFDAAKAIKHKIDMLRNQAMQPVLANSLIPHASSPDRLHQADIYTKQQAEFDLPSRPNLEKKADVASQFFDSVNNSGSTQSYLQNSSPYASDLSRLSVPADERPIRPAPVAEPFTENAGLPPVDYDNERKQLQSRQLPTLANAGRGQLFTEEDVEQSTSPEKLSSANRKDAEFLLEIFDEASIAKLYSKQWTHRQNALNLIAERLNDINIDARQLFLAIMKVLKRTISDKVAGVFLSACTLLEKSLETVCTNMKPEEVRSAYDSLMIMLIDRLGETNTRIRDNAFAAIMFAALNPIHGPALLAVHALAPLKKKEKDAPLPLKSRARLLLKLVMQYGITDKVGLVLQDILNFAIPHVQHRDATVRESMTLLIGYIANLVGTQKLDPYLRKLRPTILEAVQSKIEDVKAKRVPLSPPDSVVKRVVHSNGHIQPVHKHHASQAEHDAPTNKQKNNELFHPSILELGKSSAVSPSGGSPREFQINAANDDPMQIAEDVPLDDFEHPDKCQFCGFQEPELTEEKLDLHYWQDCPMLTSCKQCDQVIEISTLDEHLLRECDAEGAYLQCKKCLQPILAEKMAVHIRDRCYPPAQGTAHCPLCSTPVLQSEDGWRKHLLLDTCPANSRTKTTR